MALDVLSIGDPTIDTFLKIHEAHLALQVDPGRTDLCIDYADKIPVDEYHRLVAGGCVNVAISLAKLAVKVGVYGLTGADAEGATIRVALDAERVDSSLIAVDSKRGTNSSTALVFRGERTLFVWHQARRYRLPSTPYVRWIYLSSVGPPGPDVDRLHADVCDSLAASGAELAFGPGTHQLRMGARALAPLLQRANLLLLNRREGAELTGCPGQSPKQVLAALRDLGPRIVVMTDGPKGSYAYDGEQFLSSGILDAPIVDDPGVPCRRRLRGHAGHGSASPAAGRARRTPGADRAGDLSRSGRAGLHPPYRPAPPDRSADRPASAGRGESAHSAVEDHHDRRPGHAEDHASVQCQLPSGREVGGGNETDDDDAGTPSGPEP